MASAVTVLSFGTIYELLQKNLPRIKTHENKQNIVYFVIDRSISTRTNMVGFADVYVRNF